MDANLIGSVLVEVTDERQVAGDPEVVEDIETGLEVVAEPHPADEVVQADGVTSVAVPVPGQWHVTFLADEESLLSYPGGVVLQVHGPGRGAPHTG